MKDLSILIPARNEEFLIQTIDDIFRHKEGNTEVLVGLDGWDCDIEPREDLTIIKVDNLIGQRAMMNKLAGLSDAKYVMKVDAHCSFSQGFDVALMEDCADDVTIVPVLLNLYAYDWMCRNGHKQYQGVKPKVCERCGDKKWIKSLVWRVIPRPVCQSFLLDKDLVFQYAPIQPEETIIETMAIQGSGFMLTREKYWELGIADEEFGSWGQQGAEVSLKTWLSGGRVLCSRKAFMGHLFRTTDDFPYKRDMKQVDHANAYCKELFLNNKWDKQTRPIEWLIEKFDYPCDWKVLTN